MKYLKLNPKITKEQLKPIQDKIKEMGLIDKIEFNRIKNGCIYIYRKDLTIGYNKKISE